jgi:syntaxin-binding protein 5
MIQVARYGINSQTSALAYDPVQSLLALGTKESRFGSGQIYVFGQKRVSVVFSPQRKCSIERLQFCADKLISVDSKNDLTVWSLERKAPMGVFSPPGRVTALATDPALDYAFVGMQNGKFDV